MDHLISVKKLKKTREEELYFLKMLPDESNNLIQQFDEENRKIRKIKQEQKEEDYDKFKKDLDNKMRIVEGYDIKESMKNERRDWINNEKAVNLGEPPHLVKLFYDKDNKGIKVELDENQKKVAENLAKEKLKKEQDKKKKDENGAMIKCIFYLFYLVPVYSGPTEQVKNLGNDIEDFKRVFETPSEFINKKEEFIYDIAKDEVKGAVEDSIREEVDKIIQMEITNLRTIYLKGKRDPKVPKRAPKIKIPAEKFGPGEKIVAKKDINDLLSDVRININKLGSNRRYFKKDGTKRVRRISLRFQLPNKHHAISK